MSSCDYIMVPCPRCQASQEVQSKGGSCDFEHYTLQTAPVGVLSGANRHAPYLCDKCEATFKVHVVCMAITVLIVPEVKDDDDG